ncbi:MAG TPA: ATP-binding protein [Acidimicrobiales bacterium]|nr:ATP-binding protein [Acidimicrobiales bacterium]
MLRRAVLFEAILMLTVIAALMATLVAYRGASDRASSAQEDLVRLYELRNEALDLETGLRGYYIVEREEFLEPYRASIAEVEHAIAAVASSFPGDRRVEGVRRILGEWRNEFAAPILEDLAAGRRDEAEYAFASGAGKRRIDAVRDLTADMVDEVRAEVRDREEVVDGLTVLATSLAVLGGVAFLVVSGLLIRRLDRAVSRPMRSLAETADRLGTGDLAARSSASGLAEVDVVAAALDQMAERLETTVEELRSLDRMKSEFVSVVSHELRTPLTSIRGSLGLLQGGAFGDLPRDASEMLDIAVSNTDRLVRLINDILDLERIEAGHETFEPVLVDASELLGQVAEGLAGAADGAGVSLVVTAEGGILVCDRDRMVQAMTNLAGNAIKFSDPGGTVWLEAAFDGDDVVLRVRDEGRGIPADALPSIFERFSQVDASDARERGGTGLGLAIVKTIAERHGGRVDVTSTPGVGSTFSIVLPGSSGASRASEARQHLGGPLVLVVEDDVDLRRVIGAQLARHGLRVVEAASAAAAIERCAADEPDLLVLDVRLGEEDGYSLVNRLRRHDRLRNVATVIYTAYPLSAADLDRLRLGETRLVRKEEGAPDALEQTALELLGR